MVPAPINQGVDRAEYYRPTDRGIGYDDKSVGIMIRNVPIVRRESLSTGGTDRDGEGRAGRVDALRGEAPLVGVFPGFVFWISPSRRRWPGSYCI